MMRKYRTKLEFLSDDMRRRATRLNGPGPPNVRVTQKWRIRLGLAMTSNDQQYLDLDGAARKTSKVYV